MKLKTNYRPEKIFEIYIADKRLVAKRHKLLHSYNQQEKILKLNWKMSKD